LIAHTLSLEAQREASSILESRQELSELVVADAKGTGIPPLKNQPMTLHSEGLITRDLKSP
jgi:hypothetical protein